MNAWRKGAWRTNSWRVGSWRTTVSTVRNYVVRIAKLPARYISFPRF